MRLAAYGAPCGIESPMERASVGGCGDDQRDLTLSIPKSNGFSLALNRAVPPWSGQAVFSKVFGMGIVEEIASTIRNLRL
jgi:hypothetical protein